MKRLPGRLLAGEDSGFVVLGDLNLGQDTQNVILAFKIVKERPLTNIGAVRDVFNRGVLEASVAKQVHGGVKKPLAGLRSATLAPPGGVGRLAVMQERMPLGFALRKFHIFDYKSYMTISQV